MIFHELRGIVLSLFPRFREGINPVLLHLLDILQSGEPHIHVPKQRIKTNIILTEN